MGYGGMWIAKWIIGSILSPSSGALTRGIQSILYRGSNTTTEGAVTLFDVALKNMFVYLKWGTIIPIAIVLILLGIRLIKVKTDIKELVLDQHIYLIIALYPFAWYLITRNHSYEHAFMAYRELAIASFAILSMISMGIWKNNKEVS